jgi:hypothetical protein
MAVPSTIQWPDDAETRWDAFRERLRDRLREIAEDGHEVKGCCISRDYEDGQPRFVVVWLTDEDPIEFYL